MSPWPSIALCVAVLNVCFMLLGAWWLCWPGFIVALLIGIFGMMTPGEKNKANGRALAFFSIVMAALPILKPAIDAFRLRQAEAARAAQTVPMYAAMDQAVKALGPQLEAFRTATGRYPTIDNGSIQPLIDARGGLVKVPDNLAIKVPSDPFLVGAKIRVVPIGTEGCLIMSAGQDAVLELPPPPVIMDGDPHDPLAPIAATGADWRLLTYDPTNGSLGLGDVVKWYSPDKKSTRDAAMGRLDREWDSVHSLTPLTLDEETDEMVPLPEDDAATATDLLRDKEYLGAVAAASRAIANRREHTNFWKSPDVFLADFNRGSALFQLGHPRAAADCLIDYLATTPNDAQAHYLLATCLYLGRRATDAKRHFAAAFQVDPASPIIPQAMAAWTAMQANGQPVVSEPDYWTKAREPKNIPATAVPETVKKEEH